MTSYNDFMKVVVGLGNPGEKYKGTRHNVGFMVVDAFAAKLQVTNNGSESEWKTSSKKVLKYFWFEVDGEKIELVKPMTFMNKSGVAVSNVKKNHPELELDDLYIVHDDLDIALGKFKIQKGKGPKQHNGVESVERSLGKRDFWRVRVGVDNRGESDELQMRSAKNISGEKYVLSRFRKEEKELVKKMIDEVVVRLFETLKF